MAKKTSKPNHRAVLHNPGPALREAANRVFSRQRVSVRVINQSVTTPHGVFGRGETFNCTLAEAEELGRLVEILD